MWFLCTGVESSRLEPPGSHNTEFLKGRGLTMGQLLCCAQVDQSTVAIKERFGKFDEVLEPGCHCLLWVFVVDWPVISHFDCSSWMCGETKTKDNVFVNVVASVQYRALADKANDAFYKLSNTRSQIQAYVFDGTTAKDVMDMVLVTQYFDTMKEIGATSKSSAVFIPHGPGAVRDVASQIRDGLLQGSVAH
ncbi:hypothetical protein J5N97_013370 [Dioscorea zingiberensis]|uniref:Band 7 domain-containing protein n=1 Tax=Dioscorea zingiberensis TaxID=325984 RepID=A0A9D5HIJ9_9LILI|nr:hypothetical protein J5N97_013370 [Dioscorea zingiberensis]